MESTMGLSETLHQADPARKPPSGTQAASQRITRPSVLVMPVDNSVGLTVARALGREGVPVIGVSYSPDGFGLRSRYLVERHILGEPPKSTIDALLKLIKQSQPNFLMVHGE